MLQYFQIPTRFVTFRIYKGVKEVIGMGIDYIDDSYGSKSGLEPSVLQGVKDLITALD